MPDPHDPNPISVVEDLDPEPQGADRRRRLGELVLGLMLLIGVLGWGGWQWWHDTTRQTAYRAGSEAAERRDWDAARDAFRQASGYRDADSRAQDAARLVAGRDSRYASATRALAEGHPLEAFQATTVLLTIQPDYRDTRSLHESALKGAIDNALVGVAMNGLAPVTGLQPGLYVGLSGRTVRLQDSGQSSVVRAGAVDGPAGCAVYDAPFPSRRTLRLACVEGDEVRVEPLDPDVHPDDFDAYIAGTAGAWGLNVAAVATPVYQGTDTEEIQQRRRLQGALLGYDVTYLPVGARAVPYPLADSPGIVMTLGDKGSLLLAGPAWKVDGTEVSSTPGMALYLVRADGSLVSPLHPLHTQEGGFIAAQLGPNERYVLLTTYMPLPGSSIGEEHRVLLIDTVTGAASVLASGTAYSEREDPAPHVRGAFIRGGPLDGKVVAMRWTAGGTGEITLVDPGRPGQPLAHLPLEGSPGGSAYAAGSLEGLAVVGWSESGGMSGPTMITLGVLRPGRESAMLSVPLPSGDESLSDVAMRGDNAVYVTHRNDNPANRRGPVTVRGVHAPEGSNPSEVQVLYNEPPYEWAEMEERAARPAYSWHLGKEGVTYVDEGMLYVAPYDGSPPVELLPGMGPLPFSGARRSEWVR